MGVDLFAVNSSMALFSNLKYRILGYFFRRRCEADAFKASLRDVFADYRRAGEIGEVQLAVEMDRISDERRSLMKMARQVAEHYVLTDRVEDAQQLRTLYQRYFTLSRRLTLLSSTQQLLRNERDKRDAGMTDVLRMQLLNRQHYRTKFGMGARPKISSVSRRAMKLQLNEERMGNMRQELDEVLTKTEDEEDRTEEDPFDDEKFAAWINDLVTGCSRDGARDRACDISVAEIESRLQALKS